MGARKITVVCVDALSYSGTTWLNLILGSHQNAFALGPPDRAWNLRDKGFEGANRVHGEKDTFWRGFDKFWDRKTNFLIALADYAKVSHIIFDNPSAAFQQEVMGHPDIRIVQMAYFRDGRAISASYKRKNPQISYLQSLLPDGWLYHSFMNMSIDFGVCRKAFHYEECHDDPMRFLTEAGQFIGLQFNEEALRFWMWDHHIAGGNSGTIALVQLGKGYDIGKNDFYRDQFKRLQKDPIGGFQDNRWRDDLSREDLFSFDQILGEKNAKHGYERDVFTVEERKIFGAEFLERASPKFPVKGKARSLLKSAVARLLPRV